MVFVCSKSQKLTGAPKPVPPALTEAHKTLHTLMDAHWKPTIAIKTLREVAMSEEEASVLVALLEDRLAKEASRIPHVDLQGAKT